jgi:imidazoleglycerol-phosphate dehydratase
VVRETSESNVSVVLNVDGTGRSDIETGIGFLNHMLDAFARHGRFDLTVRATGDLHIDSHHTTEDIGLTLGQALNRALGDRKGIRRFGDATVPLDEALSFVVVDLGGRPFSNIDLPFKGETIGTLASEMIPHFLQSFAQEGRFNLHVRLLAGDNDHHRAESTFKALARAMDDATQRDPRISDQVPSTKGVL